jgi:hypothetical protein
LRHGSPGDLRENDANIRFLDAALLLSNGAHWASSLDREYTGFGGGRYNDSSCT